MLNASGIPAENYPDLDPTTFPQLAQTLNQGSHPRTQDTFETGVATLLDGVAQRYATERVRVAMRRIVLAVCDRLD